MFKRKLAEVAVDTVTDYLQEQFEKLKQFDLDQDGQKDVDQIVEILGRCGSKAKETLSSTNVQGIAAGLDQIMKGMSLIQKSFDQEKVMALVKEVSAASTKLTELTQLTLEYVKDQEQSKQ